MRKFTLMIEDGMNVAAVSFEQDGDVIRIVSTQDGVETDSYTERLLVVAADRAASLAGQGVLMVASASAITSALRDALMSPSTQQGFGQGVAN